MIYRLEKEAPMEVSLVHKKNAARRDLINLIYSNIDQSFSAHVASWKTTPNSQYADETNQAIISSLIIPGSSSGIVAKLFFSSANTGKTKTEEWIEKLVALSQLLSGTQLNHETTASTMKLNNSGS